MQVSIATTKERVYQKIHLHKTEYYWGLPIHNGSEMKAILLFGPTSIQSFPNLTTGQDFLHSWRHFLGLHFSVPTMAIRVSESSPPSSFFEPAFFLGGMAGCSLANWLFVCVGLVLVAW